MLHASVRGARRARWAPMLLAQLEHGAPPAPSLLATSSRGGGGGEGLDHTKTPSVAPLTGQPLGHPPPPGALVETGNPACTGCPPAPSPPLQVPRRAVGPGVRPVSVFPPTALPPPVALTPTALPGLPYPGRAPLPPRAKLPGPWRGTETCPPGRTPPPCPLHRCGSQPLHASGLNPQNESRKSILIHTEVL